MKRVFLLMKFQVMKKNLPGRSYRRKAFTQKKLQVKKGITDTKL
jgi:hypothetical protein